jgi:hypothetical protein
MDTGWNSPVRSNPRQLGGALKAASLVRISQPFDQGSKAFAVDVARDPWLGSRRQPRPIISLAIIT